MEFREVDIGHAARKPDGNSLRDPNIFKVARLVLILADKEVEFENKQNCLKAARVTGIVTEEEASQLLFYIRELERFGERNDE